MNKESSAIVEDIRKLKVQGARNVAKAAVQALALESRSFKGSNRNSYISSLIVAADIIASSRPTEPMLRNYLGFILSRVMSREDSPVGELRALVDALEKDIYKEMAISKQALVDYGSSLIGNGLKYYTHCHSSTVVSIFKEAYDDGKDFSVVVSETRPKYQGVKTAQSLSSHGIPTTLIVDSAARLYLRKCDGVFVGADAVTASGNLINKVGTSTIAHFASQFDVPFYAAAELHKFSHLTKWGQLELIEQRDPAEVYSGKRSKSLTVENPAFDLTPSKYITAYITEKGIIPPQSVMLLA